MGLALALGACSIPDAPRIRSSVQALTADDLAHPFPVYADVAARKIRAAATLGTSSWRGGGVLRLSLKLAPQPDCPAGGRRERGQLLLHGFADPPS